MTLQELKNVICDLYKNETQIPKPEGGFVKIVNIGVTKIAGVFYDAFQYEMSDEKSYRKYVSYNSFFESYNRLETTGSFNREWFKNKFSNEYKGRPCNVTTIGGIFVFLGIAEYRNNEYVTRK